MIQISVYIGITAIQNVLIGVPKCVLLSLPRKDIHKAMVINDMLNIAGVLLLVIFINLISKGELGLHYKSMGSIVEIILRSMVIMNFLEYIMLVFKRYNIYYGLANIFVIIGIGVYFARDIYFLYAIGINGFVMAAVALMIVLFLYVNHIFIDRLEIRE